MAEVLWPPSQPKAALWPAPLRQAQHRGFDVSTAVDAVSVASGFGYVRVPRWKS